MALMAKNFQNSFILNFFILFVLNFSFFLSTTLASREKSNKIVLYIMIHTLSGQVFLPIACFMEYTTLIANCLGGRGASAPTHKIRTIVLMSLALQFT